MNEQNQANSIITSYTETYLMWLIAINKNSEQSFEYVPQLSKILTNIKENGIENKEMFRIDYSSSAKWILLNLLSTYNLQELMNNLQICDNPFIFDHLAIMRYLKSATNDLRGPLENILKYFADNHSPQNNFIVQYIESMLNIQYTAPLENIEVLEFVKEDYFQLMHIKYDPCASVAKNVLDILEIIKNLLIYISNTYLINSIKESTLLETVNKLTYEFIVIEEEINFDHLDELFKIFAKSIRELENMLCKNKQILQLNVNN